LGQATFGITENITSWDNRASRAVRSRTPSTQHESATDQPSLVPRPAATMLLTCSLPWQCQIHEPEEPPCARRQRRMRPPLCLLRSCISAKVPRDPTTHPRVIPFVSNRCDIRRPMFGSHPPFVHLTVVPHYVGPRTRLRTALEGYYSSAPGGPRSGPGCNVLVCHHLIDPIRLTRRHTTISLHGGL
jgi:hypothetical protein